MAAGNGVAEERSEGVKAGSGGKRRCHSCDAKRDHEALGELLAGRLVVTTAPVLGKVGVGWHLCLERCNVIHVDASGSELWTREPS